MSITAHQLTNGRDLQRIFDLRRACTTAENLNDYPTVSDLRELLTPARLNTNVHVQLWEDANGMLIACGILHVAFCNLYFYVHAKEQGAIESTIIAWALHEMRMIGSPQNKPVTLDVSCREDDWRRLTLLERHDFVRQEEQTLHMRRSLAGPVPVPQPPEGFIVRPLQGKQEVEEYVALHRDAFGTANMTVEQRLTIMDNPDYRPELDMVVVAPDGKFAAFCVCTINREVNEQSGHNEGEIGLVGTRPAYRNMGLGRTMLLEALQRLKACGVSSATLGTTSSNANAIRLYESVGFEVTTRILWYTKAV
jgi:mycothiol synthase